MTTTFPALPWTEGDVFVNDTTGVSYTYSGGKWLASGGPEVEGQYLPLTGGKLTGDLDVNGTLVVEGDDALYIRNHAYLTQVKPNEIINSAILSNVMYDPQNGYLKGLATEEYVDSKLASPSSGRRFKYALGTRLDDGCFAIGDYEVLFSWVDLNGVVRKMPEGPDFTWTNFSKMTIWNAEGELWYAAELSKGSNWSSSMFRIYKDSVKLDRGLVVDEEYEITVEGYW